MSTPLYAGTILSIEGTILRYRLTITHPDVSDFGDDRIFAWKLLSDWVSPVDDGDTVEMAARYVRNVTLSPVEHAVVDERREGFFTVRLTGEDDPSIVYTIEVSDASLLTEVPIGETIDVYHFPEVPEAKPKPRGRTREPESAPASLDGLRDAAFAMLRGSPSAFDDLVVPWIVRWAAERCVSDDRLAAFIDALDDPHAAQASGLVAVERARRNALASARAFLARGEAKLGVDKWERAKALDGLVPARMRLGENELGERGLAELVETVSVPASPSIAACTTATVLARAGRWERIAHAPLVDYHGGKILEPALLLAFDDDEATFERLIEPCIAARFDASWLRVELAHRVRTGMDPARLVALVRRHPKHFDDYVTGAWALRALANARPAEALEAAAHLVLEPEAYPLTIAYALALHAERDRARALELSKRISGPRVVSWLVFAALGLDDRARGALDDGHARRYYASDLTHLTTDRSLACDAARVAATDDASVYAVDLARLRDLGERPWVDAFLARELERIRALPARERDLPCRSLAMAAGMVGRRELGAAASKLPTQNLREQSACALVRGCAMAWDFDGVLAALDLVPNESHERSSAALQAGVRAAEEAFLTGPRALPLRSIANH